MSIHQSLSWGLVQYECDRRNEATYRYLAEEGLRGRYDTHRDGPTVVSETFMRQRALLHEAALRRLSHEARRARRSALTQRAERRQPRFVLRLPHAWRWGRF